MFQHAIDATKSRVGIVQLGLGAAQPPENIGLGLEILDLVVQERVIPPFAQARSPADHDNRRFLGIGPRDRIAEAQPTHAIRHTDRANAVHPGIGIGGKARAVLAGTADQPQRAFFHHRVEGQHVVARDAKDVADAVCSQAADQVLSNGDPAERLLITGQSACHTATW